MAVTPLKLGAKTSGNPEAIKETAMLWLNVGYTHTDEETGEETFISLPMGIPLDTMRVKPVTGKNEDYRKMTEAKNQLLHQLVEYARSLDDGAEDIVSDLQVQIRRVAEHDVQDTPENNAMVASMSRLSFAKRA